MSNNVLYIPSISVPGSASYVGYNFELPGAPR